MNFDSGYYAIDKTAKQSNYHSLDKLELVRLKRDFSTRDYLWATIVKGESYNKQYADRLSKGHDIYIHSKHLIPIGNSSTSEEEALQLLSNVNYFSSTVANLKEPVYSVF